MIFKLLTLPFRLHWLLTLAIAIGIGYLAFSQFTTFESNRRDAGVQVANGAPDPTPLSKWNAVSDVGLNGEVNVQGVYFAALDTGRFEPTGSERLFIALADDQAREVKAVLVVRPDDMAQLQRQLTQQGSGERIPVTVNGAINQNSTWQELIWTELSAMDVPRADDLVVIEPYIGGRPRAVYAIAEKSLISAIALGGLSAFIGFIAFIKMLIAMVRGRRSSRTQSQMSGQEAMAARQSKQPSQKSLPSNGAPKTTSETSPWGSFEPQPRAAKQAPQPATSAKAVPAKAQRKPAPNAKIDDLPQQPAFKSVFPGGASGFRFKSSDEIILQTFGSLSSTRAHKRSLKRSD